MTVHPLPPQDAAPADTLARNPAATAYDSVWSADTAVPEQAPEGLERVMLAEDKLFVVLAVVLLIWLGLLLFLYRTDRKVARLERSVAAGIPSDDHLL